MSKRWALPASKSPINQVKLLEAALRARPGATLDDLRRIVPSVAAVPDKELEARIARVPRRMNAAPRA